MALDKVVDSATLDAGLTKIANAIRAKGGTDGTMQFPDEFATLIEAITSGGGGVDFSPFSSAKFGTFTVTATNQKSVTISGLSNCQLFAMRKLLKNGAYDMTMSNIVVGVLANTSENNAQGTGLCWWYNINTFIATANGYTPTRSGDTLTFNTSVGYLYGTYEWVMVS